MDNIHDFRYLRQKLHPKSYRFFFSAKTQIFSLRRLPTCQIFLQPWLYTINITPMHRQLRTYCVTCHIISTIHICTHNCFSQTKPRAKTTAIEETSHPRIAHGQRYPMPCLEWLVKELEWEQRSGHRGEFSYVLRGHIWGLSSSFPCYSMGILHFSTSCQFAKLFNGNF